MSLKFDMLIYLFKKNYLFGEGEQRGFFEIFCLPNITWGKLMFTSMQVLPYDMLTLLVCACGEF